MVVMIFSFFVVSSGHGGVQLFCRSLQRLGRRLLDAAVGKEM